MDDCDVLEVSADAVIVVPAPDDKVSLTTEVDEILSAPEVWLIIRTGC